MTTVTIILEDKDGNVAVNCQIPGGFNPDSKACNMANAIMNFLDANAVREPQEAPKIAHVAEEHPGKRAKLVLVKPDPVEIFSG